VAFNTLTCNIYLPSQTDRCPSHVFQTTKQEIQTMLRSPEVGLKPYTIRSKEDIDTVKTKISNMMLTPILPISSVTGEGIDTLQLLLAGLPRRRRHAEVRLKPEIGLTTQEFLVSSNDFALFFLLAYRNNGRSHSSIWSRISFKSQGSVPSYLDS
jgi:hypothetical protein